MRDTWRERTQCIPTMAAALATLAHRVRAGAAGVLVMVCAATPVQAQEHTDPLPHYSLALRLDPASHSIAVSGSLAGTRCGAEHPLFLNRHFRIDSLTERGAPVRYRFELDGQAPPYASIARPLVVACREDRLRFRYTGIIADTIDDVNTISPGLVELASYAGWYPFDPGVTRFTYDVTATLPRGYTVIGQGLIHPVTTSGETQTIRFSCTEPTNDIVLVASPRLRRTVARYRAITVEMYTTSPDSTATARTMQDMLSALETYASWFGGATTGGTLRFVYSPRGGWGYSRLPLIVVSEQTKDVTLREPLGWARNFEGNAHELAHFWWAIADTRTSDDWINEGLAEYSAFSVTADRFGAPIRDSLLAQYRRDAAHSRTRTPIAETGADSPDRYVNRYEKVALLLYTVQQAVGTAHMHSFLRGFLARYRGTRRATTHAFVNSAREALGGQAASRLNDCLTSTGWPPACGG